MRGLFRDSFSPYWFDRASPICDQIAILWHGAGNQELLSGAFGVLSGTTAPAKDVIRDHGVGGGRAMKFNGGASATGSYISLGNQTQHIDIGRSAPMSAMAVVQISAAQNGPFAGRNDNNAVNQGWCFDISTGFRLRKEHSSANWSASCGNPFSTVRPTVIHVCITNDGTDTNTAGAGVAYLNGVAQTTTLSAGSGTQGSDASQTLYLGGNQSGMSGAVSLSHVIEVIAVWRRMLTAAEVLSLYLDHLQLFRRRSQLRTLAALPAVVTPASRPVVQTCG